VNGETRRAYCATFQATRRREPFGASQRPRVFGSEGERMLARDRYVRDAEKRARRAFPRSSRCGYCGRVGEYVADLWPTPTTDDGGHPLVVCTGGEPLLQLDTALCDAFHAHGFEVAIETNGTLAVPAGVDWVCVSPKAGAELVVTSGDELKVVYPQTGAEPNRYEHLEFTHWFVQPMDGPERVANTAAAVAYCLSHPRGRLSVQTHKVIGIP
jgi:7-carboxy-7-deazaguanine synthase (Cx14CxxC type)